MLKIGALTRESKRKTGKREDGRLINTKYV